MMNILVSYDINTSTPEGRRRLGRIAKICLNYGQRVQNSVYECYIDSERLLSMKKDLLGCIEIEEDSIRIYKLGRKYEESVIHYGIKNSFAPNQPLIL